MRCFLIEKETAKWLGKPNIIENKLGGKYDLDFSFKGENWNSSATILEKSFEKKIRFDFKLPTKYKDGFHNSTVEINFMMAASKTEYCTEIHVLHKGLLDNIETKEFFSEFWKEKLEILRKNYNGDWIIEDKDMVLSVLKGSF